MHYAWKRTANQPVRRSSFSALLDGAASPNGILRRWFCLALPAVGDFFGKREATRLAAPKRNLFDAWHEEALQEWMSMPSWCLFRRDAKGRRIFRRAFFRLGRSQQRAILLWAFCIATRSQKKCLRAGCNEADAIKEYLEMAHLPATVAGDRTGKLSFERLDGFSFQLQSPKSVARVQKSQPIRAQRFLEYASQSTGQDESRSNQESMLRFLRYLVAIVA